MSLLAIPELRALYQLSSDGRVLFLTRIVRLFAYGLLAITLVLYLAALGLSDLQIGLVLSLTLAGDAVLSLALASIADRIGRRRMLFASAGLILVVGLVFAVTDNLIALIVSAIIGTISPSGGEVGPAAAIEQAALPQTVPDRDRTAIFAWYNLAGSLATVLGSLVGGTLVQVLQQAGWSPLLYSD